MLKLSKNYLLFLIVILAYLFSGCGETNVVIDTLIPSPQENIIPTMESVETPTATMQLNTPTPLPTLTIDEVEAIIEELYETNGNCEYPCFWGLEPGKASIQAVEVFFQPITSYISSFFAEQEDSSTYINIINLPEKFIDPEPYLSLRFYYKNQTLQIIEIVGQNQPVLTLSEFLVLYGKPDQIYVETYKRSRIFTTADTLFSLYLSYQDQGIVADFNGAAYDSSGVITSCFERSPSLWLFVPNEYDIFSVAEVINYDTSWAPLMELELSTDYTIDKFYDEFAGAEDIPCITTPSDLWHEP